MNKVLTAGQSKVVHKTEPGTAQLKVAAHVLDDGRPRLRVSVRPHEDEGIFTTMWLTPAHAQELRDRLDRALKLLPKA